MSRTDFIQTEYHEAATSYSNGVDIGFNTAKNFVVLNSLFLALYNTPEVVFTSSNTVKNIVTVTPIIGIILSVIMAAMLPLYFRHLGNCLERCVELEAEFDGKLFSRNKEIGSRKFNTLSVLIIMSLSFGILWGYVWYTSLS